MDIDREKISRAGLLVGPLVAVAVFVLLPAETKSDAGGLGFTGRATAGIGAWMATWWLTEAVPLAATALLPIVLFPLIGANGIKETIAPYASPLIFLFMGGFIIGLAIQRFGLHRRVALHILLHVGTSPRRLIAGFMLTSALFSMWISNTATAIMMLPIGASILVMLEEHSRRGAGSGADCSPPRRRPSPRHWYSASLTPARLAVSAP